MAKKSELKTKKMEMEIKINEQESKMVKIKVYDVFGIYKQKKSKWILIHTITGLKIHEFKRQFYAKNKIMELINFSNEKNIDWKKDNIENLKNQSSFVENQEQIINLLNS
jgi:hypothetical protein